MQFTKYNRLKLLDTSVYSWSIIRLIKNIFFVLLVFIFVSCSHSPKGIYEGEVGRNKIILDFTIDNIVIVKSASASRLSRVGSNASSVFFDKTKCKWTFNKKTISIYNDDKELLYSLVFQGNDLIDRLSGERFSAKH